MRIISGRHKGRRIIAPAGLRTRPTSARMREAIFNILVHRLLDRNNLDSQPPLRERRVLDAFCGTGALGLEALSRGAPYCVFMDSDPEVVDICRHNVRHLGEDDRAHVLRLDCLDPRPATSPCALLFLDPPYGEGLAPVALAALDAAGWVMPGALCCVEVGAQEPFSVPPGFKQLHERRYGAALLRILKRAAED